MANQITINIGAAANDGTGDPLRTAFNDVNLNFANVWSTGLPTSNIQFSDNRILTVNTNANLVLAPNGIGKVASNVDIVPNTANVFGLGSLTRRWNTVYGQYLDLSHNATIGGNLVVTGNLTAGNISYTSNVFVGDLEGSVFDGASSIVLDVIDSAIYVDNYRYANGTPVSFGGTPGGSNTQIQFNDNGSFAGNVNFAFFSDTGKLQTAGDVIPYANLVSNLGNLTRHWNTVLANNVSASNNISALGSVSAATVYADSISVVGDITSNNSFTSNTITSADAYITRGTFSGDDETGDGSLYVGHPTFTNLGTDVMAQFTGNVGSYGQLNFQNYSNSVTASGDYIITNDTGTDTGGFVDLGMTSSTWNGTQDNSLGNLIGPSQGYLYVQDGNLSLGTKVGNAAGKVWTFDTTGNLTVAGNILPTANNTQSLGSATQQWSDLYVSNATIYMNNVPISLTAGNVLTVNGEAVLSNDSNSSITTTGDISAGNINATGNIVADGTVQGNVVTADTAINTAGTIAATGNITGGNVTANIITATESADLGSLNFYASVISLNDDLRDNIFISPNGESYAYLSVPKDSVANVQDVRLHNDIGNVEIGTGGGTYNWLFDNTGNLNLPNNGDINFASGGIVQTPDEDFTIRVQDADDDGFAVQQQVDDGAGSVLGSTDLRRDQFVVQFAGGSSPQFRFNENSETQLPGNVRWDTYVDQSLYQVSDNTGAGSLELKVISYSNDTLGSNVRVTQSNATISTNNAQYNWLFDNTGVLTTPGGISIDGDITGTGSVELQAAPNGNAYVNLDDISDSYIGAAANLYLLADSDNREWIFDTTGTLTTPGDITVGGDVTGRASANTLVLKAQPATDTYIQLNSIVDSTIQIFANLDIVTDSSNTSQTFTFGTDGSLSVPGNIAPGNILTDGYFYANGDPFVSSNYGDSNVVTLLGSFGSNTVSTTGNVSAGNVNATTKVLVGDALSITNNRIDAVSQFVLATSNTATGNNSSILMDRNGEGVVVVLENTAGSGTWGLYQDNILFPDSSRQYSAYGNANVVANLAALGSNPISTTGNITAANFIGNVSLTGNITGTSANVELVAGSYTFTFDNTGVATFPAIGGDEGGEIHLGVPAANTTLQNTVKIDVFQDRIRFFEGSANAKGAYIDLANCADAVDTAIGYLYIPQIGLDNDVAISPTDAGKHYYNGSNTSYTLTILDSGIETYPVGMAVTIVNRGTGNINLYAYPGVNLYMAGSSATGNRTVGAYGMATVINVATDVWFINGTGVY